jgi:hypothetical protein
MVLRLREVFIESARALTHELRPGFPGEVLVSVSLRPDPEACCVVQFPAERP